MTDELSPRVVALFERQLRLQSEAAAVIMDLKLLDILGSVGATHLVGSVASGLMVWRDIDVTVACDRLELSSVAAVAARLLEHPHVRGVQIRDDTGPWNEDPSTYPDGLFIGVDYRTDEPWELDIWFVDEPDRQPDLRHVAWLHERLTDETRAVILELKQHLFATPGYSSFGIYEAVLDGGVRTLEEFQTQSSPPH